jgi:hypothetical protein
MPKINQNTDFYEITATYPDEPRDTDGIMKQFVEYLTNSYTEKWKTGGEVYNAEMQVAKDFPDRPKMRYMLSVTYTKSTSQKLDTTSYVFSTYEFTGGAHGNTKLTSFTFGPNGSIALEDVLSFEHSNDIELAKKMREKLLVSLGEYADKAMIDTGLGLAYLRPDGTFDAEKCKCDGFFFPSSMQTFTISDTGVTFLMDQYSVAPYVAGNPPVAFTWSELAAYMNSSFSLPLD